jgi:hypothetical protein
MLCREAIYRLANIVGMSRFAPNAIIAPRENTYPSRDAWLQRINSIVMLLTQSLS